MFSSRFPLKYLLMRRTLFCLVATILASAVTLSAQVKVQARATDRFIDSMGVNVHMEYTNSPYGNYLAINERLGELGMRHFRDEINNPTDSFVDELNTIGTLGYKLCGLIEGGNDYPPVGETLEASKVVPMIERLLPTIDAVEGPNEPDDPTDLHSSTASIACFTRRVRSTNPRACGRSSNTIPTSDICPYWPCQRAPRRTLRSSLR
jgi:hypothetical protein